MSGNIVISPYSRSVPKSMVNPKDYPLWVEVVRDLHARGFTTTQIGVEGEPSIGAHERVRNPSFREIVEMVEDAVTWISVDNFLPHLCRCHGLQQGVVIFSRSDPKLFGYPKNTNLLLDPVFLRKDQYGVWERSEPVNDASFVPPSAVVSAALDAAKFNTEDVTLPPVILLVSYYSDAPDVMEALRRNVAHPMIDQVILCVEGTTAPCIDDVSVKVIPECGRLSFQNAIDHLNKLPSSICIFANSDIFFDETLNHENLAKILSGHCYGLTRWQVGNNTGVLDGDPPEGFFQGTKPGFGHDAWIFRNPMKVRDADFYLGTHSCDYRFAKVTEDAGYPMLNPSLSIRAWHLHTRERGEWLVTPGEWGIMREPEYLY
jgi:hypothetical protein